MAISGKIQRELCGIASCYVLESRGLSWGYIASEQVAMRDALVVAQVHLSPLRAEMRTSFGFKASSHTG